MWIENFTDNTYVMCIAVSREPELQRELEIINEIVHGRDDCYVIISLAGIEMLTSSSITYLLMLHDSLLQNGRMLILCKVGLPTKGVFRTAGLHKVFNLAVDMFTAQTMIQNSRQPEAQKTTT
jgi:anti-anti-sigma regulatory factor